MKESMKCLGFAIVGTILMFSIAVLAASVLRSYDRGIVFYVLLCIASLSMIVPLFTMECKKEWIENVSIFCMAYFPIQIIIIAIIL